MSTTVRQLFFYDQFNSGCPSASIFIARKKILARDEKFVIKGGLDLVFWGLEFTQKADFEKEKILMEERADRDK